MPKTPAKANKSAFIRSLPADMPAVDVVAKAKAANLKLTPAFVYAIRSKSRKHGAGGSDGTPAKRGRKPASGKPTASEFVRSQPVTLKASEVVAAGAKAGLTFSTNLVYAVRSSGGGRKGGARGKSSGTSGALEMTLRRAALDLGIGRARQVIDDLERRLRDLIGAG